MDWPRCHRGLDRLSAGSEERWQQSYLLALKGFCLLLKATSPGAGKRSAPPWT